MAASILPWLLISGVENWRASSGSISGKGSVSQLAELLGEDGNDESVDDPRRGAVEIASLSASPRNTIDQHSNRSSPTKHTSITIIAQEILLQYLRQAKRLMKKWVKLYRTTGVDSNPDPAPK
jgi:hypothetical protein